MFSQKNREQLSPPLGFGILQKTLQRYEIFRNLYRFIPQKIKITFHAACENTFWARNSRKFSSYFQLKQGLKAGETSPNPSKEGGVWLHKEADLSAVFIISTSPLLEGAWGRLLQISILLQCGDGYKFKLNSTNFTVN